MTTYYCTADQVAQFLQRNVFSTTTSPKKQVVEDIINRKEDYIDYETGHAWRETTITEEYIDNVAYQRGIGTRIDLNHRKIRDLNSGTDKLEIWNGSSYVDYISTKTEGRNNDYFIDQTNGVFYLCNWVQIYPKGVRATYRYGDSSVAKQIEDACIKLTAIDVLSMLDDVVNFVDDGGTNRPTHDRRISIWQDDVNEILASLKEFRVVNF